MSNWLSEAATGGRYALAGLLNTAIGLALIWGFTKMGAAPIVANALGYAIALSVAFLNAKTFVFRSEGHFTSTAFRYALAFIACYAINVAVLYGCIALGRFDVFVAQALAVGAYVVSMYLASRLFVFPRTKRSSGSGEIR